MSPALMPLLSASFTVAVLVSSMDGFCSSSVMVGSLLVSGVLGLLSWSVVVGSSESSVTSWPLGSCPVAVAWLVTVPLSMSVWVMV